MSENAEDSGQLVSESKRILASSLTSQRIPFLQQINDKISKNQLEKPHLNQILLQVLNTYKYYQDVNSRNEVLNTIEKVYTFDRSYLTAIVKFVTPLSITRMALSDLLSLLSWINHLLVLSSKDQTINSDLLLCQANLLTTCLGSSFEPTKKNKRIFKSVIATTKFSLAESLTAFEKPTELIDAVIDSVAKVTNIDVPLNYYGVLSNAVSELQPVNPALFDYLNKPEVKSQKIIAFFSTSVILGKDLPQEHSINNFYQLFVNHFITDFSDLEPILLNFDKLIVKNSESSLAFLIPAFLKSIDFTVVKLPFEFLSSKFFKSLVNGLKNAKDNVKSGSFESIRSLLTSHYNLEADQKAFTEIITQLIAFNKLNSNVDSKRYSFELLEVLKLANDENRLELLNSLSPLVKKDQNEVTLLHSVSSFVRNFFGLETTSEDSKFIEFINAGLADKKLPLRKVWFLAVGSFFSEFGVSDLASSRYAQISKNIESSLLESIASPLISVNNKGISCSFIAIYLIGLLGTEDATLFEKVLITEADKIAVLSTKILSKLHDDNDVNWAFKALQALSKKLSLLESHPIDSYEYGLGWLYLLLSKNAKPILRLQGLKCLSESLKAPETSKIVVKATYKLFVALDQQNDEVLSLNISLSSLPNVISTILGVDHSDEILLDLIVISNHASVPIKNGFIGLCQIRNIDVGKFVVSNFTTIFEYLQVQFKFDSSFSVYKSAIKSLGQLSYIAPDLLTSQWCELLEAKLSVAQFSDVDDLALSIWRYDNESEPFVDVLAKGSKQVNKNSKDYATQKWEDDLKKELKSKGKPKKLTKEEQTLVNEQLAKERIIREKVQSVADNLTFAFQSIDELVNVSTSFETKKETWFPKLMNLVVAVFPFQESIYSLVKSLFIESYMHLSVLTSSRIDASYNLGVGALRINEISNIPESLQEEPLIKLISRILFRVKFSADQSPLDIITISYLFPLLTRVLKNGKQVAIKNSKKQVVVSEFVDEDPEEEQLLLAVEIINIHADIFQESSIPRYGILTDLISLMKLPSKTKLAKECFLSICQNISVNFDASDLKILFDNLVTPESFIKQAILESLDAEFDLTETIKTSNEIWITSHDNNDLISETSRTVWDDNGLQVLESTPYEILEKFSYQESSGLRLSVALSLVEALEILGQQDATVLPAFLDFMAKFYDEKTRPPPPQLDEYGLVIKSTVIDKDLWEFRSTVALTLKLLTPLLSEKEMILRAFKFLIDEKSLNDKSDLVRQELQDAGIELVKQYGANNIEILITIFENALSDSSLENNIKESVIILYGALGRHLNQGDERINLIVERLIKTLDTPSESVQVAISKCLPPLVKLFESNLQGYFDQLFDKLFDAQAKTFVRRGAAHGIAGLVKGAGIKSLSTYDIMRNLTDASDDKRDPIKRESVSIAFECLSSSLGKFFEPYVVEILPIILKALGDQVPEVRSATDLTARTIMQNTTSFGVKKLIPLAISNLDEIQWRTKKGSVELLGSMAYLDPAQLSANLSSIVPEIVGVLNDTHKEVRKAADQSLKRFGEVIRNPEIQQIVPDLIKAIGDPTKYTDAALDKLIKTQFVHYIDGPSLALIIHVIHRGMTDRSASTKRKACQIVGNMAILVDAKDLKPYLNSLINELEISMVDPVPSTRSTAARALGSLVEKLGEDQFPDLISKLLGNLQDESKAGDRLGSAQALSEVICGLGINKLEDLLPSILSNAKSPKSFVRAGFMPLLLYLPVCFGSQFAPYLSRIIPPILNGLADTDEDIRDTALRAGRLIVKNYAKKAIDLLLPELEIGLADNNYRIRLSSVELTGDLLFQVTGISGKNELIEDQPEMGGEVGKTLVEVLGQDRRNRVLALLFICRSDINSMVRSKAVEIWKALVANTPKTVKEILGSLTQIVVKKLASEDEVEKTIAAQTLGEMVRRVGSNALSQLLPTLEESVESSTDSNSKEGACIALAELIKSTSEDGLIEYQDTFIGIIKKSLVDSSQNVRNAASDAFDSLQSELGKVVIDEIVPDLLIKLESSGDSENALHALQDLMSKKSDVIFPILIPTLLSPPIDAFKIKALSSLASVAGAALYKKLSVIINTLVNLVIDAQSDEEREEINAAFDKILLSINDDHGVNPLMQQLLSLTKHEDYKKRAAVYARLGNFFTNTTLDYSIYTPDMVSQFILSLGDKSPEVVKGTFESLQALVKSQDKDSLNRLVKPASQSLGIIGIKGEELPGFSIPRGPNCVLPIFSHGLMYGNSEQKELSAMGIADIIEKTPSDILKPFATTITGPLIRIIGEKVSSNIKSAILYALNNLLLKIPQFLRPFIPQLQRTFVRSLSDQTNDELRTRAVVALGTLIKFQPRIDSLIVELISGCKAADSEEIKLTMLKAILEIVNKSGDKLNENSKTSLMGLIEEEISIVKGKSSVSYAKLIGSISKILTKDESVTILKNKILSNSQDEKFSVLAINAFLKESPQNIFNSSLKEEIVDFIIDWCDSAQPYVSDNATLAIGKFLLQVGNKIEGEEPFEVDDETIDRLVEKLCQQMLKPVSNSPDTRRFAIITSRALGRLKFSEVVEARLETLVPSIFANVRDPIIPIKLAAEKAYLSVLQLVAGETVYNNWIQTKSGDIETITGTKIVLRSITDYTKRVALRLASVERERIEQGGDDETVFSDRIEDENEIWSVGGL